MQLTSSIPAQLSIELHDGDLVRAAINPQAYRDLYEGRRVLIVEDHEETRRDLKEDLGKVFGAKNVDVVDGPDSAVSLLDHADPYDIICLDVYKPNSISGLQLMEKRGDKMKAVIVYTASIPAPDVFDLVDQINRYQSNAVESMLGELQGLSKSKDMPYVPIFVQHKSGTLASLLAKMGTAVLISEHPHDAQEKFLAEYKARVKGFTFREDLVHSFAQEVRTFAKRVLKYDAGLRSTAGDAESVWERNHSETQQSLGRLINCQSDAFARRDLLEIDDFMHAAYVDIVTLSPPDIRSLDLDSNPERGAIHQEWFEACQSVNKTVQALRNAAREEHEKSQSDTFEVNELMEKYKDRFRLAHGHTFDDVVEVNDPEGEIRKVIDMLAEDFSGNTREFTCMYDFIDDQRGYGSNPYFKQLYASGADKYIELWVEDPEGSMEDLLSVRTLTELRKQKEAGKMFFGFDRKGNDFRVFIKLTSRPEGEAPEILIENIVGLENASEEYIELQREDCRVLKGLGRNKDIILIGDFPNDMMGVLPKGVIFEKDSQLIFASHYEYHFTACGMILHYMAHCLEKDGDTRKAEYLRDPHACKEIYRDKSLIRLNKAKEFFDIELGKDPRAERIFDMMEDLGVERKYSRKATLLTTR